MNRKREQDYSNVIFQSQMGYASKTFRENLIWGKFVHNI